MNVGVDARQAGGAAGGRQGAVGDTAFPYRPEYQTLCTGSPLERALRQLGSSSKQDCSRTGRRDILKRRSRTTSSHERHDIDI